LKIAIIRQRYNPHGGAERFVSRALSALSQQQSVEMHLIARKWEALPGIEFHRCNPFYLGRISRDLGFAIAACRIAKNINADLVQSHERLSCCDIYRAGDGVHREWLKQRSRLLSAWQRLLLQANPYHLYIKWAERRLYENTRLRAVICNSHMVKNEILRQFRIDASKIHVIRNGIDTQSFHPKLRQQQQPLRQQWNIPLNVPVFVFVGSGFERKGLHQTITALSTVADAFLVVVGHDKNQRRYQNQAKQQGVQQRVLFTGAQTDVKPFYGMADAFILPTLYDPFSNAVLEAMACGLPVITSHQSGAAELVTEGESGFVCDALDTDKIATRMQRLTDRKLAQVMGEKARSQVEQLDWSLIGEELLGLYTKLVPVDQ
jgi:UDP-glucose:(heptosyl)LPS alpha-1,3-glucosyltransferase